MLNFGECKEIGLLKMGEFTEHPGVTWRGGQWFSSSEQKGGVHSTFAVPGVMKNHDWDEPIKQWRGEVTFKGVGAGQQMADKLEFTVLNFMCAKIGSQ